MLNVEQIPEEVLAEVERLMSRANEQLLGLDRYLKDEVFCENVTSTSHEQSKHKRRNKFKFKEVIGEAQHEINGLQQGLLSINVKLNTVLGIGQL